MYRAAMCNVLTTRVTSDRHMAVGRTARQGERERERERVGVRERERVRGLEREGEGER